MRKKLMCLGLVCLLMFSLFGCEISAVRANKLAEYKTTAKEELDTYATSKDENNYTAASWAEILECVAEGKTAIDAAKNEPSVDTAVTTAKLAIDDVIALFYGVKPADLNQPMPEIWEDVIDGAKFDFTTISISSVTEITIGRDITQIETHRLDGCKNLENIYVEEGNQAFVSDDGVLYSKSYLTLYKWPAKKPVTAVRGTVKFFEAACFAYCLLPEGFELPDGTVSIGQWAFAGSNLTKLHIKKNVKTVGRSIYPQTIQEIEVSAPIVYHNFFYVWNEYFNHVDDSMKKLTFREGVRQIRAMGQEVDPEESYSWLVGRDHFHSLLYIERIEFPSTLQAIGAVSFPVNISASSYTIPKNVAYLDKYAFDDHYVDWASAHAEAFEKYGILMGPPIYIERNVITEFESQNGDIMHYIEKMLSIWERSAGLIE